MNNKNGQIALLITIVILGAILSIGLGLTLVTVKEMKMAKNIEESNIALQAADAGMEYALWETNKGSGFIPAGVLCGTGSVNVGAAEYCLDTSDGIKSSGKVRGNRRTIRVSVSVSGGVLPDSGQTSCWNAAGTSIICGNAPQGQDAEYTSSNSATCDPSFTDNGDGTITDNCTNLIWQKCQMGRSGSDCSLAIDYCTNNPLSVFTTWANALSYCETLNCAGYTNWRLPNIKELVSIVNYQNFNPSVDTTYFPPGVSFSNFYVSSTSRRDSPGNFWVLGDEEGTIRSFNKIADQGYVRCVRDVSTTNKILPDSGQTSCWNAAGASIICGNAPQGQDAEYTSSNSATCDPSFTDNGDGTITDNCTNLIWQKCQMGQSGSGCSLAIDYCTNDPLIPLFTTWANALSYCETLNCAGYTDWRLPNIKELLSIVNYQNFNPSVDTTYFPGTVIVGPPPAFGSATSRAQFADFAWAGAFGRGYTYHTSKTNSSHHMVRCVRDVNPPSPQQIFRFEETR